MHIDDETNLSAGDDTEAGQAGAAADTEEEVSETLEAESEETDEEAGDGQSDDEEDDYEVEGKQYRIPKSLKGFIEKGVLLHKDYTQKTQTVAEARKQVESMAAKVTADFQAKQAILEDLAEAKSLEKQIDLFKGLNWDAIQAKDMGEYLRLQRQFETAKSSLSELTGKITQKQHEQSLQEQQETAKQLEEGLRVLKGKFPDWTPQTFVDLGNFGVSLGFSQEEVNSIADPRYMEVLHFAKIGKQFVESQKRQKPSKPAASQQPELKPVTKVTKGRPGPVPLSDKQSIDDWMKTRVRQIGRR